MTVVIIITENRIIIFVIPYKLKHSLCNKKIFNIKCATVICQR